mgnify:CR=1 FL=1
MIYWELARNFTVACKLIRFLTYKEYEYILHTEVNKQYFSNKELINPDYFKSLFWFHNRLEKFNIFMIAGSKKNKKTDRFSNIFFSILFWLLLLTVLVFLVITNIKI